MQTSAVEIAILSNDKDPDGDKLNIMSMTSPSQNGGIVAINENGTVTFFPRNDNTGTDRFSYTVSDGEGNSDKARVSVIIKVTIDRTADKQSTLDSQGNED